MWNKLRNLRPGPLVAWLAGAVGLLLGVVVNRFVTDGNVVDVVGAALGAAVAVLGAVFYSQISRRDEQMEYRKTLIVAIVQLQAAATMFKTPQPGAVLGDSLPLPIVKVRLEHIQHRYEHLSLFRPYDRVGNFVTTSHIGDLDVVCRGIRKEIDALPAKEADKPPGIAGLMGVPRMTYNGPDKLAGRIDAACQAAIKSLTKDM